MKDNTDIFFIDPETKLLVINKKEIIDLPEFKAILIRDKGGHIKGDSDGRKKLMAHKEFMFIYLYANPTSLYRDLPDAMREVKCKNHAGLPEIWKLEPLVLEAIKAYTIALDLSALFHSYVNANRAVYALGEDIKFFNSLRDKMRDRIKDSMLQLEAADNMEDIQLLEGEVDHTTSRLMDLGVKINNISNALPNGFDTIEKLKKRLIDEQKEGGVIYGGGKLGKREG